MFPTPPNFLVSQFWPPTYIHFTSRPSASKTALSPALIYTRTPFNPLKMRLRRGVSSSILLFLSASPITSAVPSSQQSDTFLQPRHVAWEASPPGPAHTDLTLTLTLMTLPIHGAEALQPHQLKHVHPAQCLILAYSLISLNHVHAVSFCQHIMHLTYICLLNLLCMSVHTIYWGWSLFDHFFFFNSRCSHYIISLNILHFVSLSALQSYFSFTQSLEIIQTLLCLFFLRSDTELIKDMFVWQSD